MILCPGCGKAVDPVSSRADLAHVQACGTTAIDRLLVELDATHRRDAYRNHAAKVEREFRRNGWVAG